MVQSGLKKTIAGSLMVLFLCFYAATTLFYHAHRVDGIDIHHSHPYAGSPEEHDHSQHDLILIDLITASGYILLIAVPGIVLHTVDLSSGKYFLNKLNTSGCCPYSFHLRAPPEFS
ncbi:MAG: hypothetical protein ACNA7V_08985 [Bacteroidales bacterium]